MRKQIIPIELIEKSIFIIRSEKIMLDRDLAELYQVTTKALNQAVKRNLERFPSEFMFQLNKQEKYELVTNCDRLGTLKHSTSLPYAFTEQGVAMLSSILKSKRAIQVNIQIMKTFVQIKRMYLNNKELADKINELEKKYDKQFKLVFDALRALITTESPSKRKIGF